MSERFEFTDLVRSLAVVVEDGRLRYRAGMGWKTVSIAALDAFYVDDKAPLGVLILKEGKEGGAKRHQITGRASEPGFQGLLSWLETNAPEADIRELSRDDAIARVGYDRPELVWFPFTAIIFMGFALIFAWPHLMHGFDAGSAHTSPEALASGETLESDNLVLEDVSWRRARPLVTVSDGDAQRYLIPLYLGSEEKARSVFLRTPLLDEAGRAELVASNTIEGILRDNLFEGLSSDEAKMVSGAFGADAAENAVVVEAGVTAADERFIGLASTGTVLAIILIMFMALALRERHRRRRRR